MANALRAVGIETEPAVYDDDFADLVGAQLSSVDGVLVWVNPIERGRDRSVLDAMLRRLAAQGVLVSAHPNTILLMGTKDVLFRTQRMSWGCETHLYATMQELRESLTLHLSDGRPRVLKQYRGNGGDGVWQVERHPGDPALIRVRHALRGSVQQDMALEAFIAQCKPYFARGGHMIGQLYQARLTDGMVRCYLVQDKVVGFGHQAINALFPAPSGALPEDAPPPGARLYYAPTKPEFQAIRVKMETEWLPTLCQTLGLRTTALPLLWDADFLFGPKIAAGEGTYVLCEINVSAVSPFPQDALQPLAQATKERLLAHS